MAKNIDIRIRKRRILSFMLGLAAGVITMVLFWALPIPMVSILWSVLLSAFLPPVLGVGAMVLDGYFQYTDNWTFILGEKDESYEGGLNEHVPETETEKDTVAREAAKAFKKPHEFPVETSTKQPEPTAPPQYSSTSDKKVIGK